MFSSNSGPMGIGSAMTGLPRAKTHRGKKGSGKPFAHHVGAIQKAHGAGDLQGVKTHALALVNAVHRHLSGKATVGQSLGGMPEGLDENETPGTAPDEGDPMTPSPLTQPKNNRASLARLASMRRK